MIEKFGQNSNGIKKLCNTIKEKSKIVLDYCSKIKSNPSVEDYYSLKEIFLDYNIYHITPRHLADFLSEDKIKPHLKELAEIRTYTEKFHYAVDETLKEILSKLLKATSDEVQQHSFTEIEQALKDSKLRKANRISEYFDFCFISTKERLEKIEKDTAQKLYSQLNSVEDKSEITGTIAYPGKATGRVRIVLDPSKKVEFNHGDILVAEMTRPEYVPLMNKAAAVVTDGGGSLCHAAIVARELKKPCIIGTKNATKILQNDDLVEVDADKGIVRKLK
jgi:phosphoenolpyruvate synthase/pyruvate phosphate dikinase